MTAKASSNGAADSASAGRTLGQRDYKTLALSALGGTLEFYDFVSYVFFATVLGGLFFPADMPDRLRQLQTFGICAACSLAPPPHRPPQPSTAGCGGKEREAELSVGGRG